MEVFWIVVLYGVVCGTFTSRVACEKGYSGEWRWFWAGFFFGLIALIAACGLPDIETRAMQRAQQEQENKGHYLRDPSTMKSQGFRQCPTCKKWCAKNATDCPECGHVFS